jgi:hypothetical protein
MPRCSRAGRPCRRGSWCGVAAAAAQELEQRYGDFRLAVQSALDAGEAVTYPEIVQRLGRRDRRVAQAARGPAALRGGAGAGDAAGGAGGAGGGASLDLPPKGARGGGAVERRRQLVCRHASP